MQYFNAIPQIRSPHTSLHVQSAQALVGRRTERHRVIVDEPTRSARNAITVYMGLGFVARAVRFLWCILWLNDTSYRKSVKRDK